MAGLDVNFKGTVYWYDGSVLHGYPSVDVYNSWHIDNDFTRVVPANPADGNLQKGSLAPLRQMCQ